MKRVTGLGGIFFKSKSGAKDLSDWYEKHLGIDYSSSGGYPHWKWRQFDQPEKSGETAFSIFNNDTKYFQPSTAEFMINFRVENLAELLIVLREEGVEVAGEMQEFDYGKFAWIIDPDGNKIELWEPAEQSGFEGGMPMY